MVHTHEVPNFASLFLFLVLLIFISFLCLPLDDDVAQGNTEKVSVRVLHEAVPDAQQAAAPPASPLGREALHLLHLHEGLHPEGPSQHAQEARPPRQGVSGAAAAISRLLGL